MRYKEALKIVVRTIIINKPFVFVSGEIVMRDKHDRIGESLRFKKIRIEPNPEVLGNLIKDVELQLKEVFPIELTER